MTTATATKLKATDVLDQNQLSVLERIGATSLFEEIINLSSVDDVLNFTNLEGLRFIWLKIKATEPKFKWKDLITSKGLQILVDSIEEFVQSREDGVGEELPQGVPDL